MSTQDQQDQEHSYKEHLQRLQAEFENYQKQTQKFTQQNIEQAQNNVLKDTLEIIDNLQRALKHQDNLKEGLTLTLKQAQAMLKKYDVKEINEKGQADPDLHDVIAQQPAEEKQGTIIEVIQRGYIRNNKALRHSKVIIAGEKQNE